MEYIEAKSKEHSGTTGEFVVKSTKREKESFFFTFFQQLQPLYNSTVFGASTKLLFKFLEYAEFNTGKIIINSTRIEEILRDCHIARATYYRTICELITAGVIRKEKMTYYINESMFWKGDKWVRDEICTSKNIRFKDEEGQDD